MEVDEASWGGTAEDEEGEEVVEETVEGERDADPDGEVSKVLDIQEEVQEC